MPRKDFRLVRDKFARDEGLPFGRMLTRDYVLNALESEGHKFRNRTFCPLVTLWGWLSQCLSQDKSLNEAVSRILANRVASGLPACSASSAAYTKARTRFPGAAMARMAFDTGRRVHDSADSDWKWRGRQVFLADGTCFGMADTEENRAVYPAMCERKGGLALPIMRSVALISLATGAVVDMEFSAAGGKATGEASLLRKMLPSLSRDDILVADRYYPGFFLLAQLRWRKVDIISISHVSRPADFTEGHVLSERDHIATWHKPKRPKWMDAAYYAAMPQTIQVREFSIEIEGRKGGKERVTVVSTITDPSIPQKELSDLYWKRWNCELDIRSIKHSMHLDVIRCKTPAMVRKEIWAHVLAYNLLRGTMVESAKRNDVLPRQISIKGTMQAVESFTPAMMAIDGNTALYDAFLVTVAAHRVGNRPGRLEPRLKKRYPAWNSYMHKPRAKYRRRLASEARSVS
jgi:hypothetical protein